MYSLVLIGRNEKMSKEYQDRQDKELVNPGFTLAEYEANKNNPQKEE